MTVSSALRSRQLACVRALRHAVPSGIATECRPFLLVIARKLVSSGWTEECAWLDKPTATRVVRAYGSPDGLLLCQKELEGFLAPVPTSPCAIATPSSSSAAGSSTDPAPRTSSPPRSPLRLPRWRVRHRASEIYATQLKADPTALTEKAAVIQRNWKRKRGQTLPSRETIKKRLVWQSFCELPDATQHRYEVLARDITPIKKRAPSGRFARCRSDDIDALPLSALAAPPPKASKLSQRDLAKIGRGFLDNAALIQSDGSQSCKHLVRKLAASVLVGTKSKKVYWRIAKIARPSRTITKLARLDVRASLRKRGRARKKKVSDAELRALLEPCTSPTCRWSQAQKCIFRTLNGTLKSIYRRVAAIHKCISYSALSRRLKISHSCPLGIGKASKQTDKCPIDVVWDSVVGKRCRRKLVEILRVLEDAAPRYFEKFAFKHDFDQCSWDAETFSGHENELFVVGLRDYIADRPTTHPLENDAALLPLEAVALADLEGDDGLVPLVTEFTAHWKLRDMLSAALTKDLSDPEPGVVYFLEDFKE